MGIKIHYYNFISDFGDWNRKALFKKKKSGEGIQTSTLKNPEAELCIGIS